MEIDDMIPGLEQRIKEAKEKMEGIVEKEISLTDIVALQSFDKDVLSKVIEKVYVYSADRVEIIWKFDDIFFSEDITEKRKIINPKETSFVKEAQ